MYSMKGDHVRVIGGRYEGDTGLIVRVEDNMVVLFSDLTMHELKTLPKVKLEHQLVFILIPRRCNLKGEMN